MATARFVPTTLFAVSVLLFTSVGQVAVADDVSAVLANQGSWQIDMRDNYNNGYTHKLRIGRSSNGAISVSITMGNNETVEARSATVDGTTFTYVRHDPKWDRLITTELEMRDSDRFEGTVTGPRSRNRSGTFLEKATMFPSN